MSLVDPIYTANLTEQQHAWFFAEYEHARRDEVIGVLLAIFLGTFSWTGIPTFVGWVEAFFMPRRVRQYNALQAAHITAQIRTRDAFSQSPSTTPCAACGGPVEPMAAYCPHCGQKTVSGAQAVAL